MPKCIVKFCIQRPFAIIVLKPVNSNAPSVTFHAVYDIVCQTLHRSQIRDCCLNIVTNCAASSTLFKNQGMHTLIEIHSFKLHQRVCHFHYIENKSFEIFFKNVDQEKCCKIISEHNWIFFSFALSGLSSLFVSVYAFENFK
jgi:hypothetical protein